MDLRIISDSLSAISSRKEVDHVHVGVNWVLRPDRELKIEVNQQEQLLAWASRNIEWTKSHVLEDGEPSYETKTNQITDDLAMMGRDKVVSGTRDPVQHHFPPGAMTGATVDGENVSNKMVMNIQQWLTRREMRNYLCDKFK